MEESRLRSIACAVVSGWEKAALVEQLGKKEGLAANPCPIPREILFRKAIVPVSRALADLEAKRARSRRKIDTTGEEMEEIVVEQKTEEVDEPILTGGRGRFVLDEPAFPELWKAYKAGERSLWTASEIRLDNEASAWASLSEAERVVTKRILAFFAASDGIVNENLAVNFIAEVRDPHARAFYAQQAYVETVHQEAYALLLKTYVTDRLELAELFRSIEVDPTIKAKADWALKWIGTTDSPAPFPQRLLAFAAVEGIHFCSSFAYIYWLKNKGRLPALTQTNEWIARDETTHWQFAAKVHGCLKRRVDPLVGTAILKEAAALEEAFVESCFPDDLVGIGAKSMKAYVHSVTDMIAHAFGIPTLFGDPNPFDFMRAMNLDGYSNFFEVAATEYQVGIGSDSSSLAVVDDF